MGNQFLNKGGLEKSFNRSMSGLPRLDDIAKKFQDRFEMNASTELQPRQQRDEQQFDTSSIFG